MQTLLIQLTNQKALKLLQELEELHLIKVIHPVDDNNKLSQQFAGKLQSDIADKIQRHISQSRQEWSNSI